MLLLDHPHNNWTVASTLVRESVHVCILVHNTTLLQYCIMLVYISRKKEYVPYYYAQCHLHNMLLCVICAIHVSYLLVEDISGIVEELHVSGYSSVLSWLSEYLINEAEDREIDDEWEEMCIVPQDENQSLAFNEKLFRDLLVSVGFTLPDNQVNLVVVWYIRCIIVQSYYVACKILL